MILIRTMSMSVPVSCPTSIIDLPFPVDVWMSAGFHSCLLRRVWTVECVYLLRQDNSNHVGDCHNLKGACLVANEEHFFVSLRKKTESFPNTLITFSCPICCYNCFKELRRGKSVFHRVFSKKFLFFKLHKFSNPNLQLWYMQTFQIGHTRFK